MSEKKSFEVARETLKQLTARKLAPTPGNYKSIYNEIAGIPSVEAFPARELKEIAHALPAKTPGQQKQRGLLEFAIERMHWDGIKTALVAYGSFTPTTSTDGASSGHAPLASNAAPVSAPALTTEFLSQIGKLIEYASLPLAMMISISPIRQPAC